MRDFRLKSAPGQLLLAAGLSSFGDGVQVVALPLLGASLTSSPAVIASLAAVGTVPALIGALPVGALVDRARRARLMVLVDVISAVALLLPIIAISSGSIHIWELFVLSLCLGICELIFTISSSALVPDVVPKETLGRFNGYFSSLQQAGSGFVGPACAGLLFAVWHGTPFAVNAVSFVLAACIIAAVIPKEPRRDWAANQGGVAFGDFIGSIRQGARWLRGSTPMMSLALLIGGWSVFGWMPESVLVLFAKRDLHTSSFGYGLLLTATAAGAVLGGLVASRIVDRLGPARLLSPCLLIYAASIIPPAFMSNAYAAGAMFFIQGLPMLVFSVASVTVRQAVVPKENMGRVSSIFYLFGAGLAPVGLLLGGLLGDQFGLRSTFVVGGLGIAVVTLLCHRTLVRFKDCMPIAREEPLAEARQS